MLLKIKVSVEPCLVGVVLMRDCSSTDEYKAGKEKNHSILSKLDYTTGCKQLNMTRQFSSICQLYRMKNPKQHFSNFLN